MTTAVPGFFTFRVTGVLAASIATAAYTASHRGFPEALAENDTVYVSDVSPSAIERLLLTSCQFATASLAAAVRVPITALKGLISIDADAPLGTMIPVGP